MPHRSASALACGCVDKACVWFAMLMHVWIIEIATIPPYKLTETQRRTSGDRIASEVGTSLSCESISFQMQVNWYYDGSGHDKLNLSVLKVPILGVSLLFCEECGVFVFYRWWFLYYFLFDHSFWVGTSAIKLGIVADLWYDHWTFLWILVECSQSQYHDWYTR